MAIEILGWIGSLMVVSAYGLISYQKVKPNSILYFSLNIIGGILLVVYSYYKGAYANIFINVVWIFIAIPALINAFKAVKKN
jgi:lipid-A-disaccharide synthase-like uncharacterized protein